jgi:antitoxin component of RelBE/YafQ-DinJ toxin-antitoxin module
MKTQLIVKTDKEVKIRAQKTAKELGLPLSALINAYLKEFIVTKEAHFYVQDELKPEVKKRLDRLTKEAREGKNLSPVFDNVEKAIHYLNS